MKILHITGTGHSGSTLLATLLAQNPNVSSCGELNQFPKALAGVPHECSCGRLVTDCEFWRVVAKAWNEILPDLHHNRHAQQVRLLQREATVQLKKHGRLNKNLSANAEQFVQALDALFLSLGSITGVDTLVDSSKNVGRAALLAARSSHDVKIIHLIRDPRGVAWSHRKERIKKPGTGEGSREGRSVVNTMQRWKRDNALALNLVRRYQSTALTLRYEDLVLDSDVVLKRISALSGIDFGGVLDCLKENGQIAAPHMVAGNPNVRMRPVTQLMLDNSWRENLTLFEKAWCVLSAYRLTNEFGYI